MQDERNLRRRAASKRDAARARLRWATGIVLAASVALAGSLAGYVASAASGHKTAVRRSTTTRATAQVPGPAGLRRRSRARRRRRSKRRCRPKLRRSRSRADRERRV
jgi:hypothetical protein